MVLTNLTLADYSWMILRHTVWLTLQCLLGESGHKARLWKRNKIITKDFMLNRVQMDNFQDIHSDQHGGAYSSYWRVQSALYRQDRLVWAEENWSGDKIQTVHINARAGAKLPATLQGGRGWLMGNPEDGRRLKCDDKVQCQSVLVNTFVQCKI